MVQINRKQIAQSSFIALLVSLITILNYHIDSFDISSHILLRELYFLPIILAGSQLGICGGIGASLLVTLLHLPFIPALPEAIACRNLGNGMQIVLYNIFGLIFGVLGGRQKRQQRKLLDTESLAAMGRAVSCIAHDMKTPLVAIGGFIRQVRRKETDDDLARKLDIAFEQVGQLETLIGDMLAFAKPLNLQFQQGMINHLIEEVAMLCRENAIQHAVKITMDLQEDVPVVEYDRHRLRQALLNLANNALEASPEGSEVIFRSRRRDTGIIIEIVDRGDGIPKKLLNDIFTPFMTTKKAGTGLGLPIAKKVVEAHEGSLEVVENGKNGVTFRVIIPFSGGRKIQTVLPGNDEPHNNLER